MLFMDTTPAPTTYTARVVVRHAATCKDKAKGSAWRKCKCRKSLLVYDGGGSGGERYVRAKNRSWGKGETVKEEGGFPGCPEEGKTKKTGAVGEAGEGQDGGTA